MAEVQRFLWLHSAEIAGCTLIPFLAWHHYFDDMAPQADKDSWKQLDEFLVEHRQAACAILPHRLDEIGPEIRAVVRHAQIRPGELQQGVVRRLPAQEIGHSELGQLSVGAIADVSVFSVRKGEFGFQDNGGGKVTGDAGDVVDHALVLGIRSTVNY